MKCKYRKICPHYKEENHVCNKAGGMYYADETEPAGCYRRLEKAEKEGRLKEEIKLMGDLK